MSSPVLNGYIRAPGGVARWLPEPSACSGDSAVALDRIVFHDVAIEVLTAITIATGSSRRRRQRQQQQSAPAAAGTQQGAATRGRRKLAAAEAALAALRQRLEQDLPSFQDHQLMRSTPLSSTPTLADLLQHSRPLPAAPGPSSSSTDWRRGVQLRSVGSTGPGSRTYQPGLPAAQQALAVVPTKRFAPLDIIGYYLGVVREERTSDTNPTPAEMEAERFHYAFSLDAPPGTTNDTTKIITTSNNSCSSRRSRSARSNSSSRGVKLASSILVDAGAATCSSNPLAHMLDCRAFEPGSAFAKVDASASVTANAVLVPFSDTTTGRVFVAVVASRHINPASSEDICLDYGQDYWEVMAEHAGYKQLVLPLLAQQLQQALLPGSPQQQAGRPGAVGQLRVLLTPQQLQSLVALLTSKPQLAPSSTAAVVAAGDNGSCGSSVPEPAAQRLLLLLRRLRNREARLAALTRQLQELQQQAAQQAQQAAQQQSELHQQVADLQARLAQQAAEHQQQQAQQQAQHEQELEQLGQALLRSDAAYKQLLMQSGADQSASTAQQQPSPPLPPPQQQQQQRPSPPQQQRPKATPQHKQQVPAGQQQGRNRAVPRPFGFRRQGLPLAGRDSMRATAVVLHHCWQQAVHLMLDAQPCLTRVVVGRLLHHVDWLLEQRGLGALVPPPALDPPVGGRHCQHPQDPKRRKLQPADDSTQRPTQHQSRQIAAAGGRAAGRDDPEAACLLSPSPLPPQWALPSPSPGPRQQQEPPAAAMPATGAGAFGSTSGTGRGIKRRMC